MSAQLLILPEGKRFTEAQENDLRENGFIVVYVKNPEKCRLIAPEPSAISGNAILHAALKGLRCADSTYSYRSFVDSLLNCVPQPPPLPAPEKQS
jgi:hypothetical protein